LPFNRFYQRTLEAVGYSTQTTGFVYIVLALCLCFTVCLLAHTAHAILQYTPSCVHKRSVYFRVHNTAMYLSDGEYADVVSDGENADVVSGCSSDLDEPTFDDWEISWFRELRSRDLSYISSQFDPLPRVSRLHWISRAVIWFGQGNTFVYPVEWARFWRGVLVLSQPLVEVADLPTLTCLMSILAQARDWLRQAEDLIGKVKEKRKTGEALEEAKKEMRNCISSAMEQWLELGEEVLYPKVLAAGASHRPPTQVWGYGQNKKRVSSDKKEFEEDSFGENGSEDSENPLQNHDDPHATKLTDSDPRAPLLPETPPLLRRQCTRCMAWKIREEFSNKQWKISGFCRGCSKS
jgi:hypothetical protein